MDARGLGLGRLFGVPVVLRPSWFLIAAAITLVFAPTVEDAVPGLGAARYLVALAFAVLLLVSVFVHEAAHSLAASATGTSASHIVLDLWGGHTAFEEPSRTPGRSATVAAAGPATNAAVSVAADLLAHALPPGSVIRLLVVATAWANLVVAAFNALPGLPLDGGRVLEALVWRVRGDRLTGTRAAAWAGRAVAAGVAVWALGRPTATGGVPWDREHVVTTVWLLLVAFLMWRGAGDALAVADWHRRAPRVTVGGLARPAVPVPSRATVADAEQAADAADVPVVVLLDVYGRPAALVDRAAVATVPPARRPAVAASVVGLMLPPTAVVAHDLAGEPLLMHLRLYPHEFYAVLGAHGEVTGVLELEAVSEFVTARD